MHENELRLDPREIAQPSQNALRTATHLPCRRRPVKAAIHGPHGFDARHVVGEAHGVLTLAQIAAGQRKHLHVEQLGEVVRFGRSQRRGQ